jgi:phosphoserine phosphatase
MTVYLVRHGQTDWNLEHRFQANADIPLNETGRRQAYRVRAALDRRTVRFVAARTSPLSRARETAEILLAGTAVVATIDPRLGELRLGDFEGRLESDLREELGPAFDAWRTQYYRVPAPNGETLESACDRAGAALRSLLDDAPRGDVLIVGHQAINMALAAVMSGERSADALRRYCQSNDEIDVWDPRAGERLERIKAA